MSLNQKDDAFKGSMILYKQTIFLSFFFFIPIIFLTIKLFSDYLSYESECRERKDDRLFMKEQVSRMEDITADFLGQKISEKLDEGMDFNINPIHRSQNLDIPETKAINIELESLEFEKETKEAKKIGLLEDSKKKMRRITQYREMIDDLDKGNFDDGIGIDNEMDHDIHMAE